MGILKKSERALKRVWIGLICAVVRTEKRPATDVAAESPKRILVVRQHHQMGDMLVAVPAFRAIKETFPNARLDVVSGSVNRDVLLNNPYIDHVWTYDRRRPFGFVGLMSALRPMRYDWVIVLHTISFSFTSALIGLCSGARVRIGSSSASFGNPLSRSFYHVELPLPGDTERVGMNEVEHNLYPLRALGIDTKDLTPLLVPSDDEQKSADRFFEENLSSDGAKLIVLLGATKPQNVWPPENFARVVTQLAADVSVQLCVIEGPIDAAPVRRFREAVGVEHVLVRRRPIGEVAAMMQRADLVLCNDTGVMHVASASGARTLAVFGPTDPARWAPFYSSLSVIRAEDGDLQKLTPQMVYEKARSLLAGLAEGVAPRRR